MTKSKMLFSLIAALFAVPALAASPIVSGIGSGGGATTVRFQGGATGYAVTFDNLVLVFTRDSGKPTGQLLAVAEEKPDSHGRGKVRLVSAADHPELVNGAEFQLMGLGKEWRRVVKSATIQNGSATVEMPYLGDDGWQLSTGKVKLPDTWAWASKGWPHEAYEAYDACGNPLNVWGAGRKNLGAPVTDEVKTYIKANLPCPPGQMVKR